MKKLFCILFGSMLILTSQFSGSCSLQGTKANEDVFKAFNLRMSGKSDEAKKLLESVIARDSTNAMAYYELARLQDYMGTGGGDLKVEDIISNASTAARLEPKNVTYAYFKAISYFFKAFISMMKGQEQVKPFVEETSREFENVLKLKPDYYEAMMYLVEIYGMLPKDMGGDSLKAVALAEKMATMDKYYGAKAKAALLPESGDKVKYWEDFLVNDKNNPEILAEIGKAYLFKDDPQSAEKYFNEAIRLDPAKNILILDLARYHMYKVMSNKELAKTELPLAQGFLDTYLKSNPEPIIPLKTYAMGLMARADMGLGKQEEAESIIKDAKALDPYFSRASGVPSLLLFDPPDKITHHYFSFFSPF